MKISQEFDDVPEVMRGFGSLDGSGATEHYSAPTRMNGGGAGIDYKVHCDNCGHQQWVTISWDEFIYVANRAAPPGWGQVPQMGVVHPNAGCNQCRALLLLTITPDEASKHLTSGKLANKIPPGYIEQASRNLAQSRAGYRG